jgi:phosphatidylglycerol---prolipoprotein diacylglyceryl transferase
MLVLAFPPIDPVLFTVGPFAVRWYALAYLFGFLLGWRYCMGLARQNPAEPQPRDYDDFLVWAVIGTVLGGRIGYSLFYQPAFYLNHPLDILYVWHGGMSFHGGMLGVIAAAWLYTRNRKIPFFAFSDLLACVTPIGLGLGRLANFVNGELYGRVTDVPWAVLFPRGGDLPRHPSQLYEAGLEGLVLFALLAALSQIPALRARYGFLSGVFLMDYGLFRFLAEFFREPDVQLGYVVVGTTMGQLLSVPMFVAGVMIIVYALRRKA